jgi:hypothetical protein
MTLGRTPAGAVKIKTDGALGLRAVNCACCSTCCPLPAEIKGKKFAVTAVSWSSLVSYSTMDACGIFSAQTADGYSIYVARANISPFPECLWDELWVGTVYNGGPTGEGNTCNLFSSFIFAVNPTGTHAVIDDYTCGSPQDYPDYDPDTGTSAMYDACIANAATCYDWTLTISEVP